MRKSHVSKNVDKDYKTVWFVLGFFGGCCGVFFGFFGGFLLERRNRQIEVILWFMQSVSNKIIEIHSRQMGACVQTHQHLFPLGSCFCLQSQALSVWLSAPGGSGFVIPAKILSTSWTAHKWHHCGDDWWKNSCLACFFFSAALLPLSSEATTGNPQEILLS